MLQKKNILLQFFLMVLCIFGPLVSVQAADKVVVIPLFGHGKPLKNIVTVAKSGGKFTDPVAAVNSITDASATNPYLVIIAPGVYTLTHTLIMKPWVDVAGSGENVTKLTGAISNNAGTEGSSLVHSVAHAVLSNLRVENTGGGFYSIGIYAKGGTIRKVSVKAVDGDTNRAIEIFHSSLILIDVNASAGFGHQNIGIANYNAPSVQMNRVVARAIGGSYSLNDGILNSHSQPVMFDVTAEAEGGMTNCGVRNRYSSPYMREVTVKAWDGSNNYGIYNEGGTCAPIIQRSSVTGSTYGIYAINSSGTTLFSQSAISGGSSVSGSAHIKCVACDDGNGNALNNACQ